MNGEEVYKQNGKWESWILHDAAGRIVRERTAFDGEFNSEWEYRYDGQGRQVYCKTTSVNDHKLRGEYEQWFQPDKSPYAVLRRGVNQKGNRYWMGEDGMHMDEETWNKALSELENG